MDFSSITLVVVKQDKDASYFGNTKASSVAVSGFYGKTEKRCL